MTLIEYLPTFTGFATPEEFREAYDAVQCVCFKQVVNSSIHSPARKKRKRSSASSSSSTHHDHRLAFLNTILDTFNSATCKDQASWCIENNEILKMNNNNSSTSPTTTTPLLASAFLSQSCTQNGYCSFVLQDDSTQSITKFTENHVEYPTMPLNGDDDSNSSLLSEDNHNIFISQPYWLFVGRNNSANPMRGRSEHTDSIHHDGTFHHQVVGRKTWKIRPTDELRTMCDEMDLALLDCYVHTVEEGDVFVMNTRLWWHQTEIPGVSSVAGTEGGGGGGEQSGAGLSISYARDIYLDGKSQPKQGEEQEYMSSIDGAWATGHIPKGTILFTEKDPPMSRSKEKEKANCEMFEIDDSDEDEGRVQLAVVTSKDIKEGEFFILLDNSDRKSEEEEEGTMLTFFTQRELDAAGLKRPT